MTLHDDIDTYLAADLHNELSADEQNKLHAHLVECATCRKLHQETKSMNNILEENLAAEKADPTFEQRMLASFRNRIPQRSGGLTKLICSGLFRSDEWSPARVPLRRASWVIATSTILPTDN